MCCFCFASPPPPYGCTPLFFVLMSIALRSVLQSHRVCYKMSPGHRIFS
uniref:Uncharacterized protein n=1 Tax=Anguilla anguilla TaxID=7936 RepID=A0A0E9RM50_ANGAN